MSHIEEFIFHARIMYVDI